MKPAHLALAAIALAATVWILTPVPHGIEILTALGTLGTLIYTALSATAARDSAKAARDAVLEQREGRQTSRLPVLSLESRERFIEARWQPGEGVTLKIRTSTDGAVHKEVTRLNLLLRNFGGGPALDIKVGYRVGDGAGELTVPEKYARTQRPVQAEIEVWPFTLAQDPGGAIAFATEGHKYVAGVAWQGETFSPHCGQLESQEIELPHPVLMALLLEALKDSATKQTYGWRVEVPSIEVTISYRSLDGQLGAARFHLDVSAEVYPSGGFDIMWPDADNILRVVFKLSERPAAQI